MHSEWAGQPRLGALVAVSLALVGAACGTKPAVIPPGYEPLNPTNKASFPAATAEDSHPEQLNVVTGHEGDNDTADGQGYIHAPIMAVWTAMQTPHNVAQYRRLVSNTVTGTNTDKTADVSFTVHDNAGFGVEFDLAAWELATMGTKTNPTTVVFRDDLVMTTGALTTSSNSIILTVIDGNTTSYSVIRHQNTLFSTPATAAEYATDVYNQVKAVAHGMPLPTY